MRTIHRKAPSVFSFLKQVEHKSALEQTEMDEESSANSSEIDHTINHMHFNKDFSIDYSLDFDVNRLYDSVVDKKLDDSVYYLRGVKKKAGYSNARSTELTKKRASV